MDTLFNNLDHLTHAAEINSDVRTAERGAAPQPKKSGLKSWSASLLVLALVAGAVIMGPETLFPPAPAAPAPLPPSVSVAFPSSGTLLRGWSSWASSPRPEGRDRPQVGGTLTKIGFNDGAVVRKGDLLVRDRPHSLPDQAHSKRKRRWRPPGVGSNWPTATRCAPTR